MKQKVKIYNKKQGGAYAPLPSISPYLKINKNRIRNTKFSFRKTKDLVNSVFKNPKKWLDIGSAHGEMIYFLANIYKNTQFIGIDITKDFINTAKKLNKKYNNAEFHTKNIFNINKKKFKSNVVTCLGTFQIFPYPEKLLDALLNLVDEGGLLVIDGRFNSHDVSAIIKYKDDSTKSSKNLWRCDFNLHSELWIKDIISKRSDVKKISFHYPVMDTKIPKRKNAPDINTWTVPRKNGGYDLVNGLNSLINPSFLVVKKK